MADDFFSYSRAGSTTVFEPQNRPYVAGYLLCEYIDRTYGDEALKEIHKEFLKFPFFGPGRAIKKITGYPAREIFAEVVEEVKERASQNRYKPAATPITPDGYGDYYTPQISKRGWIMYRRTHDLPAALVLYDPETGDEKILHVTGLTDPSSFAVDPAGNVVVYSSRISTRTAAGQTVFSDLFLLDTESRKARRITKNERLWHPAINPRTGEIIAVAGFGQESSLVSVDPETGDYRILYRRSGAAMYNPVFSEDGNSLFFTMNTGGMQDIWVLPYPIPAEEIARPVTGPDKAAEFFPRCADGKILYASDKNGSLSLYAQPLTGGSPVMVAEDPVGAYAGLIDSGEVIYATYTKNGYALKKTALTGFTTLSEPAGPVSMDKAFPPADPGAAVGENDITLANEESGEYLPAAKRYHDNPKLLLWLPLPFSYDPFDNFMLGTGGGVFFSSGSILRSNSVAGVITYDWEEMQPTFDLEASIGIGQGSLAYRGYYGYYEREDGGFLRNFSTYLLATYPLLTEYRYPIVNQITTGGAIRFDTASAYPDPFGFFSEPDGLVTSNLLQASGSIGYTTATTGAVKDFYNPFLFSTWIDLGVSLPPEYIQGTTMWVGLDTEIQAASLIKHQVIGIGIEGVFSPRSDGAAPQPYLRSGLLLESRQANLSLLAALEYRFHIALLDMPLPYGYSLNHIAGSVYVESAGFADSSGLTMDRYLYPGFEVVVNFGSVSHFPIGIGIGFRIDPQAIADFTPLSDTRVYVTGAFSPFLDLPDSRSYPIVR